MSPKIIVRFFNKLPLPLKHLLFTLRFFISNPRLLLSIGKHFNNTQTIVVLSFPRSGSSWVGGVIGKGDSVRYLREPITTSFMKNTEESVSVFEQEAARKWTEYMSYIDMALEGKAMLFDSIIKYPKQWEESVQQRSLVIKEVNPLVVEQFINRVEKIVYLVRHPFSVAKSYQALGWISERLFEDKFGIKELKLINEYEPDIANQGFWYKFGYMLGWVEAHCKDNIKNSPVIIVKYEKICQQPLQQFELIFKACNLSFEEQTKQQILNSLSKEESTKLGDFSLLRKQHEVAFVYVSNKEKNNYQIIMDSYKKGFYDYCQCHGKWLEGATPEYKSDSSDIKFE